MAVWCPTCKRQQEEIKALHQQLGMPDDLVSARLDIDRQGAAHPLPFGLKSADDLLEAVNMYLKEGM